MTFGFLDACGERLSEAFFLFGDTCTGPSRPVSIET
ncbi:hypothetical protein SAMN05421505_1103, partial [Sinosporangium album]